VSNDHGLEMPSNGNVK